MNGFSRLIAPVGTLVLFASAIFIGASQSQGGSALVARSQLRRTVDPSKRAAFGSVLTRIDQNSNETFQVKIGGLGDDNFGLFLFAEPSITTNVVPGLDLPPLNRTNLKQGNWSRTLVGTGQAPTDLLPFFDHLTQLDGNSIDIAQPGIPDVTTTFTNVTGGVTNISLGVTNIVGGTTNVITGILLPNPGQTGSVFTVLWAPLYGLTSKPSQLSFHGHATLDPVGDASPNATGTVSIRFDGTTGRSILKIRAAHLTAGHEYTLFVADSTNLLTRAMIPADKMTQKDLGSTATFVRDTRFADPLPQQARDIGELSGRLIQIRDAFDTVHLQGFTP